MGLWKREKEIRVSSTAFSIFRRCKVGDDLDAAKMLAEIREAEEWLELTNQPNYYERARRTRRIISELREILTTMRSGHPVKVVAFYD